MIIKRKLFSDPETSQNDVRALKTIGKTGLVIGGTLGTAAGVELGRSVKDLNDIKGDISGIKKLRKNKFIRGEVKKGIQTVTPTYSDQIINKIKWAEQHFPKINKIDKYTRLAKLWNTASDNVSRTTLDNADRYTKMAVDNIENRAGNMLGDNERKQLRRIPYVVKKASKSITHFKNAKTLKKGALIIGGLGGTSYINGRMIEGGSEKLNNNK